MNDAAREILVAAALRGHRQAKNVWHGVFPEGECAQGLLHLTMHDSREDAIYCGATSGVSVLACRMQLQRRYAISDAEWAEICKLNDAGHDFLDIARKLP